MTPAAERVAAAEQAAGLERCLIPAPGADLACWRRAGTGHPTALWLHGAAGDHGMWLHQFDHFPGEHLFADLRGQGQSTMYAGERTSLRGATDDIGRVLDAYGVDRVVLIGSSWGGNPAQEFAYTHPERVAGLVFVGSWGQHRLQTRGERWMIKAMTAMYRALPWGPVADYCGKACSRVPDTQAAVAEAVRRTGRQVYLDLGLTGYADVRDVRGKGDYPAVPTLLVRGARDAPKQLAPIYAYLTGLNPAAREVVIPDVGHVPMLDTPDVFNEVIAEFLAGLTESHP